MILREATEDDLDGILAIFNQVIATSTAVWIDDSTTKAERRQWMTGLLGKGYPVYVAIDAQGVAGYGGFGEFRGRPGYRYTVEHSVHVREGSRRSGVGRALLERLIARAAEMGMHAMIGGIDGENTRRSRCTRPWGSARSEGSPRSGRSSAGGSISSSCTGRSARRIVLRREAMAGSRITGCSRIPLR